MIVLLDANVLYPPALRDLFLWLAAAGLYRPRWSDAIHEEWIRSVIHDRPDLSPAQFQRTRQLMNAVDPDCLVSGYEERIPALHLPDPDDRHVLAAAITAKADVLVTFNLGDFPVTTMTAYNIQPLHPDTFLCSLLAAQPNAFRHAVDRHHASLRRPPKTFEEYVQTLEQNRLSHLAQHLREANRVL